MSMDDVALIEQKAGELCAAIVAHKDFPEMFRKLDAFLNDELAKFEFQMLNDRANLIQQKQMSGIPVTPEEMGEFEALRESVLSRPVSSGFMEAQEKMREINQLVYPMLSKTFEIGRVPVPDDFLNDCCNQGCGTH